jgi:ADP-ribosylarginine hydrolase
MTSVKFKYIASMVLSGVGDALGYKNGAWELCYSGVKIHNEVEMLGGWDKLIVNGKHNIFFLCIISNLQLNVLDKDFMVSDDTVMHLATGEGIHFVPFDAQK